MMILFGFIIFPISQQSYILKAAKKLFLARTSDKNLFKNDPKMQKEIKGYSEKV
jgi:hypothetical protein